MNFDQIELQKLNLSDLKTLVGWASNEGWNPGNDDAEVFWNTDSDGFYGYFIENQLIAGGAIVSYNNEYGFMGLFIVHPEFRSLGLGRKLWFARRDLLLSRLKSNSSIGMDGVLAMQPFYNKGGFNIAFKDERYEFISKEYNYSNLISPIGEYDYNEIVKYDTTCFGFNRAPFLKGWLSMPESKALLYKKDNKIEGYAVIRKAELGYKIGPLFADNEFIADELFKACASIAPNNPIFLDIPVINLNAISLVKKYGGKYVFECARMYYGKAPSSAINQVYGITTFELG